MAFDFEEASSHYVSLADDAALTLPSSDWFIGGWVKLESNAGTGNQYVFAWSDGSKGLLLFIGEDSRSAPLPGELVTQFVDDSSNNSGFPSTDDNQPFTSNLAWTYVGVGRDGTNLKLVVNGTEYASTDITGFVGLDTATSFFFGRTNAGGSYFDGLMAEWAKWDKYPTADERNALAKGFAPSFFPTNLKWYVPMIRTYQEIKSNITVTNGSTSVADHPAIIYPAGLQLGTYVPDITVTMPAPIQLLSSYSPQVLANILLPPSAIQLLSSYAPSLVYDKNLSMPIAQQLLTAYVPSVGYGLTMPSAIQLLTAYNPSLVYTQSLTMPSAIQLLTAYNPEVSYGFTPYTYNSGTFTSKSFNTTVGDFVKKVLR